MKLVAEKDGTSFLNYLTALLIVLSILLPSARLPLFYVSD